MKIYNFKKIVIALAIAFTTLTVNIYANEQLKINAVYELFDAMELSTTFGQIVIKVVDMQIQQNPSIAPYRQVMLTFFAKYMGWESMKYDLAKIYISKFSLEEIYALKKFYETPLGKKTIRLVPELTAEGGALGQKRVQENMSELQKMITEESERLRQN